VLKNNNIVFFANDWNADNRTSSHQIASILAKKNRVFFVEAGGMRAPSANVHDIRRIFQKMGKYFTGAKKIPGEFLELRVASLFLIPLHRFSIIQYLNRTITFLTMRYFIWRYKYKKPIVFYFLPHIHYLCGKLGEEIKIFYCIDNYSAFPGVDSKEIQKMDADLTKRSDLVFVVSQEVIKAKEKLNNMVYYSPHGVDIESFSLDGRKFNRPDLLDYAGNRPIVMYWGLIADWMDFELVNYLVEKHRDIAFFLMGRVCCDPSRLIVKENLCCPGTIPYRDLAQYAYFSSALIIPFLINDWTKNINPLKMKEYLATGKPVISTAIPEALRNKEYVRIAQTKDTFSELLLDTIRNPLIECKRRQLDYIRQLTWEKRVTEICEKIVSLDETKKSKTQKIYVRN
jgi:glycosyltransferase involved in cell wall biosynthesis